MLPLVFVCTKHEGFIRLEGSSGVDFNFQLMQVLGQVDHVGLLKPKDLEYEFDH